MFIRRSYLSSVKTKRKVGLSVGVLNKGEAVAFVVRSKKVKNVHEKNDAEPRKRNSPNRRDIFLHSFSNSP